MPVYVLSAGELANLRPEIPKSGVASRLRGDFWQIYGPKGFFWQIYARNPEIAGFLTQG
jgi:hypothetical protein